MTDFYKTSDEIKFCSQVGSLKLIYSNFFKQHQEILDKYRKGSHKGIRWITSLNKEEDIELVKKYNDEGIEIRHAKELSTSNFALSDKTFLFTIEKIEKGKMATNVLSSNDKLYLDYYNKVFENLWKKGIDINERMKDIEKGTFVNVEIIPNREESIKVFNELFKDAKKEILIILSSANAFFRIDDNIGFKEIEDLSYSGVKAKILIPLQNRNKR